MKSQVEHCEHTHQYALDMFNTMQRQGECPICELAHLRGLQNIAPKGLVSTSELPPLEEHLAQIDRVGEELRDVTDGDIGLMERLRKALPNGVCTPEPCAVHPEGHKQGDGRP